MITKGIVEEVLGTKAKVRLPIYDGIDGAKNSTKTKDLYSATICSLPNIDNPVSVGDIVFVSFEDNDNSKPVILGHLYRKEKTENNSDINVRLLTVNSTTKLTKDTFIGEVKPLEIQMLQGLRGNIQSQFNDIKDDLDKNIDDASREYQRLQKNIDIVNQKIIDANISNLVTLTSPLPDPQNIEADKIFSGKVTIKGDIKIDSNKTKNDGGLVVLGTAANHPLRVRGISGINNTDESVDDALYLNYDGINDLTAYKARPVYLGGLDSNSIAVRQDMLNNAISDTKKDFTKSIDNIVNANENGVIDTLNEISDWINKDEDGVAKILSDLNRAVYKAGESGEALNQDILGTLLLNGGQVYANASAQTISNIDTMTTPGQYGISGSATNIPVKQSGTLYVAEYSRGNWCQQTYITNPDEGSIRVFRRGALKSNNSSWSEWSEIITAPKVIVDRNAFELMADTNNNTGLELGRRDGVISSTYIDFHTSKDIQDFNSRIYASGNNLEIITGEGGTVTINGSPITTETNAVLVTDIDQDVGGVKTFTNAIKCSKIYLL